MCVSGCFPIKLATKPTKTNLIFVDIVKVAKEHLPLCSQIVLTKNLLWSRWSLKKRSIEGEMNSTLFGQDQHSGQRQ